MFSSKAEVVNFSEVNFANMFMIEWFLILFFIKNQ